MALIQVYKNGLFAKIDKTLWKLNEIYIEDYIDKSGSDWNFDQHKVIDTKANLDDFKSVVSDYLSWEVSKILKKDNGTGLGKQ